MHRLFFSFLLLSSAISVAAPVRFSNPEADRLAVIAVEKTLQARYAQAWLAADSLAMLLPQHPAGPIFHALASFARYDDLSEVVDLRRASRKLRTADSLAKKLGDPFWSGVTEYERGYELTIWGSEIKGALTVRSGARQLMRLGDNVDAQAMSAIYDYYFSDAMSWIPFVTDQRENAVARLEKGIAESRYFAPLYRTALVWVYWAKGQIDQGLAVVDPIVKAYPSNRIFPQARGDLLRKGGRFAEALLTYQKSLGVYGRVAPRSVRYLCAKGNMVLLHHQSGDLVSAKHFAEEFRRELPPLEDRIPTTLLVELKKTGYLR